MIEAFAVWTPKPSSAVARGTLAGFIRWVPALLLAVPALPWIVRATVSAAWTTLGRDQGIFQYTAWAVEQGETLYRDIRDVNGPVVTMVHAVFLALGGANEHRFRVLDLVATGISFAVSGALVPSILESRPPLVVRLAWAAAAWVALSAQYLVYGFWSTAQRESFLDWFVLVSLSLQAARSSSGDPKANRTRAMLALAGFLSFVPWLGKPTYAVFTLSQVATIAFEPIAFRDRARRLAHFFAGGAAGLLGPLAFVALHGDLRAWVRITFVDVPAMYRFIWPRSATAILTLPGYDVLARTAMLTTLALGVLVLVRRLPWRAVPIATFPTLGLVSVVAQAKGFPYHFHPVTLGSTFGWVVVLGTMTQRLPFSTDKRARIVLQHAVLVAAALLLGVRSGYYAWLAPDPPAPPADARDEVALESAERLLVFERIDFFPRPMREAAEYVAAKTSPTDRVQVYAMDPYFLFLAKRRSATPYIYAYDLNADAALHGSFDADGPVPNEDEKARIVAMQLEHARDLQRQLERSPPAAFVFADRSPLMSHDDAVFDFAVHCPQTMDWLRDRYRPTAVFDGFRVWLRDDIAADASREP